LQAATVEDYLKADGWPFKRVEDKKVWQTGVKTSFASFRIFITLSEHWVFCQMPLPVRADKDRSLALCQFLLRKNFEMNLAKFALEEDGTISLNIELLTEDLTRSNFSDALSMLSAYIEQYYPDLNAILQRSRKQEKGIPKTRKPIKRTGKPAQGR
jgi:hypothetical protein